jgi:hypothetical protein
MTSPGAEPASPALRGRQADSARRRARVTQAIGRGDPAPGAWQQARPELLILASGSVSDRARPSG